LGCIAWAHVRGLRGLVVSVCPDLVFELERVLSNALRLFGAPVGVLEGRRGWR
jgi:hypothetical protein